MCETHPERLFEECSHYCELITSPKQAPRVVQIAMQQAISQGGVSVIVLPGDIAGLEADDGPTPAVVRTHPVVQLTADELQRLADLITASERVRSLAVSAARLRTTSRWRWPS